MMAPQETITIASPLTGWVTPLEDVPDPVFAGRMLGDGVAIDPTEGMLRAPGAGRIVSVHTAGHAVTIELDAGPVLLLHIGLDTVALSGEGFQPQVAEGDRVSDGDVLIAFDLALLARRARSLVTPMVVTNGEAFRISASAPAGAIAAGDMLLQLEPLVSAGGGQGLLSPEIMEDSAERTLRLPLAHGLHARPAARLSALAASHGAVLEVMAPDGRTASMRSAVAVLALSLSHGTRVTLRARGVGAVAALDAVCTLIESGMDEYLAVGQDIPGQRPAAAAITLPRRLGGGVAVPGIAIGPAWHVAVRHSECSDQGKGIEIEREELATALAHVRARLCEKAQAAGPLAAIAAGHAAMLDDPELEAGAIAAIAAGRSAGAAWSAAIARFAEPLRASPDKRFAERVADLLDIEQSVLAALSGQPGDSALPPLGAILVGGDILPSQLMALAGAGLAGIACGAGGTTSHVAIIAAGLGLPMLCSLGPAVDLIEPGTQLMIRDGHFTVDPSESEMASARAAAASLADLRRAAEARSAEPAVTRDGARIEVFANLGSLTDAHASVSAGAEGCGLLRTEFLFLGRSVPPTIEEQRQAYQDIADALGPRPLIVRTLDIGADKPVPWLAQPHEENPALGLRGIRLQLANAALLEDQLRALVAIHAPGGLRVMLPMVSDLAEIAEARRTLSRLAREMGRPMPDLGIMVETPAAALLAGSFAAEADFFSIGSNDLSQYTLARDRTTASVAAGLDALHPAVLRLIVETVKGARKHGRWTGLCGGLAADPVAVPLLVGLGLDELSAPPAAVAMTKQVIRGLDRQACEALARRALNLPDADAVRALASLVLEDAQ